MGTLLSWLPQYEMVRIYVKACIMPSTCSYGMALFINVGGAKYIVTFEPLLLLTMACCIYFL